MQKLRLRRPEQIHRSQEQRFEKHCRNWGGGRERVHGLRATRVSTATSGRCRRRCSRRRPSRSLSTSSPSSSRPPSPTLSLATVRATALQHPPSRSQATRPRVESATACKRNTSKSFCSLVAVCYHSSSPPSPNQRQSHSGAGVSPRGYQLPEPLRKPRAGQSHPASGPPPILTPVLHTSVTFCPGLGNSAQVSVAGVRR